MSRINDPNCLAGFWKLNGRLDDYSGRGYSGTFMPLSGLSTSMVYADAPWGNSCGSFGISGGGINLNSGCLDIGKDFSINLWANKVIDKGSDKNSDRLISLCKNSGNSIDLVYYKNNSIFTVPFVISGLPKLTDFSLSGLAFPKSTQFNEWHNVCFVRSGTTGSFYFDGVNISPNGLISSSSSSSGGYFIGARLQGNQSVNFTGMISDVRFYQIGLNKDEVMELFKKGQNKFVPLSQPIDISPGSDSSLKFAILNKEYKVNNAYGASSGITPVINTNINFENVGINVNSSGNRIVYTKTGSFFNSSTPLTITAWVNPVSYGAGSTGRILDFSGTVFFFVGSLQSGRTINYANDSTNFATATTNINLNEWSHVAAVRDLTGSGMLYLNGNQVGSALRMGTLYTDTGSLCIGNRFNADRGFDGKIKDLRIYNEVKNADFINKLYTQGVPDNSLVLDLNTNKDYSLYENNMTISGNPIIDNNKIKFNGTGDYMTIPYRKALNSDFNKMTINLWVNTNSLANTNRVFRLKASNALQTQLGISTAGLLFLHTAVNGTQYNNHISDSAEISTNKDFMLTFTYNGSNWNYYRNGEFRSSGNVIIGSVTTSGTITENIFGYDITNANQGLYGTMSRFRIWNRDLSSAEISEKYEKERGYY